MASQPLLTGFHEVVGPFIADALRYAFTRAKLSVSVFPAQAVQNKPDLLFAGALFARSICLMIFSPGLFVVFLIFQSSVVTMSNKHSLRKQPDLDQ